AELWLKSEPVRRSFIRKLKSNVDDLLKSQDIRCKVVFNRTYIIFEFEEKYSKKLQECITRIAGIHGFCFADKVEFEDTDKEFKSIKKRLNEIAREELMLKHTFAIRVRREGKHPFKSRDVEISLGSFICETFGNRVNLSRPDKTFFVEMKDRIAWIYTKQYLGMDGIPAGVEGKIISLIRNDKNIDDDLMATIMMIRRGGELYPVIFGKDPTEEDFEYTRDVLKKYDARVENRIDKISCSALKSNQFREKLKKRIEDTRAKAICVGVKPDDIGAFFSSAKLFSNRHIAIDRIPVFMPLIGKHQ
ncbi:MAG: hypothetical protein KAR87_01235, partial [Candidatus Aenigmarchaeota archaeon]|nr:hypothetical protein [Candidatus Aenigmarchaeota archaeon]